MQCQLKCFLERLFTCSVCSHEAYTARAAVEISRSQSHRESHTNLYTINLKFPFKITAKIASKIAWGNNPLCENPPAHSNFDRIHLFKDANKGHQTSLGTIWHSISLFVEFHVVMTTMFWQWGFFLEFRMSKYTTSLTIFCHILVFLGGFWKI